MTIDLSKVADKYYQSGNYKDEYKEKSEIIFNSLSTFKSYNYMIVSIHVYNIISTDIRFKDTLKGVDVNNELRKVGEICGYECYVDMYMDPYTIVLSYDKAKMRDSKIDFILKNKELLKEKEVKIIS